MNQNARTVHLATLAHAGLLWDAYLEPETESATREVIRACIRFSSPEAEQLYRTAAIIIEASWDDAIRRAKGLDDRQLGGLLRSVLPEVEAVSDPAPPEGAEEADGASASEPRNETPPETPESAREA